MEIFSFSTVLLKALVYDKTYTPSMQQHTESSFKKFLQLKRKKKSAELILTLREDDLHSGARSFSHQWQVTVCEQAACLNYSALAPFSNALPFQTNTAIPLVSQEMGIRGNFGLKNSCPRVLSSWLKRWGACDVPAYSILLLPKVIP